MTHGVNERPARGGVEVDEEAPEHDAPGGGRGGGAEVALELGECLG